MSDSYKHSYKVGENLLSSLSVYNVGYQKCEPEYQWGPGVRDHYCIHHILSGSGVYTTGKVSVRLGAGDTFILFPGVELQYQADREEPWEYCWAGFMGADAASIIRNTEFGKESPYILKGRIPGDKIRSGMEQIYMLKGNTYESAVAMTGKLYSLLALFMHYSRRTEPEKNLHAMYVDKAVSYIETNYSYPVTVEDIAAYVGISRSHLFRSFQNYMSKSPKDFLTGYRIKQACHLLRETDLSVSAIAYSVGFENNLYFSKAFRKQKGVSPSEYRKTKNTGV
nr:AraC family transcriptional regulator [uncultured Mediterraneibacter sp.]